MYVSFYCDVCLCRFVCVNFDFSLISDVLFFNSNWIKIPFFLSSSKGCGKTRIQIVQLVEIEFENVMTIINIYWHSNQFPKIRNFNFELSWKDILYRMV